MKVSNKSLIQGLLLTAPIVFGSTIAISPVRAASIASTSGSLVLENFTWQGTNPLSDATTSSDAVSSPGSLAEATAPSAASAETDRLGQFSVAVAEGSGPNYFATAKSSSDTALQFDTQCGCFQFDFSGALSAIAQATEPGEKASAKSFVAFYIFDTKDLTQPFGLDQPIDVSKALDYFEASLSSKNPFNLVRSSDSINLGSISELGNGIVEFDGFYQRHFDEGTQLTVRGVTRSEAVATVPEPPMFAALVILPGLMWMKRRSKQKAMAAVVTNRQFD